MRVFVMFDLPTLSATERRAYNRFRKYLIKSGFIMDQESIYTKLCMNAMAARTVYENVRNHSPDKGLIQLMMVTEKQYSEMEFIIGEANSEYVNSTDRLVVL